jgi:Transglycosylase-like domain
MQWPEPAYTEQSLARLARWTKGGAVRIRIALGTAVAVIATPAIFFAFFSSSSAASARLSHHGATSPHRTVKIDDTLMSYAQAVTASKEVAYANTVEESQVRTYFAEINYLKEVAFLKAVAAQQEQQAAAKAAAPQPRAVTAPAPVPVAAAPAGASDATSTNTADWACIRQHESGDNYSVGNGGAYQFQLGTWTGLTGLSSPAEDYPPAVQDSAALKLYSERGWEPWTTRFVCGL